MGGVAGAARGGAHRRRPLRDALEPAGQPLAGRARRELLRRARPKPTARFVLLRASGGWTTNLPLDDFDRDENLFATHHDGEPLSPEHGGPLRAVIPHLYFWKSAKWVRAVELLAEDRPGFWELNGYHARGDPWNSERFGDPPPDD